MSQIESNLWIGTYGNAYDQQFLEERKITHVLCCAKEFPSKPPYMYITSYANQWFYLPLVDDESDFYTRMHLEEGAKKINEWLSAGHTILVHCHAGRSRSVSVAMAYYMIYRKMSLSISYWYIKQKRNIADPHTNYLHVLTHLDPDRQQETQEPPPSADPLEYQY